MKKIVGIVLLTLVTSIAYAQTIHNGNMVLTTQTQVDNFNHTEITGFLRIGYGDGMNVTNITNLNGLRNLTRVRDGLTIVGNPSLLSLRGLDNLITIGGNQLDIRDNASLTSLNGLESLMEITGLPPVYESNFSIEDNPSLTSLSGLGPITTIYEVFIDNNSSLTSLSGLESLAEIRNTFTVQSNPSLTDFCAISLALGENHEIPPNSYRVSGNGYNLPYDLIGNEFVCNTATGETFMGNLTLENQESIDTFNHRTILGNLTIRETSGGNITSLANLQNLEAIHGNLTIQSNLSLTSLSGLDDLTTIEGNVTIQSNESLTSLSGLDALNELQGYLSVLSNPSLRSLSGLTLTEIGRYLRIVNNSSLSSLSGLDDLIEVGGYLTIQSNVSLLSLNGLESLTDIGENLSILSNSSLMSLSGLEALRKIGENLEIQNNTSLTNFCVISPLIGNDNQITSGEYIVIENSYNPPYDIIGNRLFCHNEGGTFFSGDLILNSQDEINTFNTTSYTAIIGDLIINETVPNNITNLSGLSELTQVFGDVTIQSNDSLMSFSGLEMLNSIGGRLIITENTALTDFCLLSSLVGDDKEITIGEYTVRDNGYNPPYPFIQNGGLCSTSATVFGRDLILTNQASIDTFSYSIIIGNLTIDEGTANNITNLAGLSELTQVFGDVTIQSNASLTSLSGLELLDSIEGRLIITGNTALTDFCTVSSLVGDDKEITRGEYFVIGNSYNPSYALIGEENFCDNVAGNIFIGNLRLEDQASIEASSYSIITGNLTIDEGTANNITNLAGLSELTQVFGDVTIQSNESLTSLSGLELLDSIGGTLSITGNTALTDFCVISSLVGDANQITSIEYTLHTNSYNPPYALIGEENFCDNVAGNIFIGNLRLEDQASIEASSYSIITGNLTIDEGITNNITNLAGLSELTQVFGDVTIQSNDSLTSLSGLELLDSIGGTLSITGNTALTNFCAISSLVGNNQSITNGEYTAHTNRYNPSYAFIQSETLCDNSDGEIFIGNLTLASQAAIDTFNYRGITGNLTIDDAANGNITNLDSLRGLSEVRGFLSVGRNDSLTSLSGLEDLIEIEGTLYIGFNASLTSLSGLDALTTVNGILQITNNTSLTSLSGLEMLESIGGVLSITSNPALTNFCSISSLIGNDKQITMGEYTLNTNGYNPPYTFIQNESLCSLSAEIFDGNLTLDTQASIDTFRYRRITGNLTINDAVDGNITNLDSLRGLIEVRGFLSIGNNDSLLSLSGLDALTTIGGTLYIGFNASLTSLSGLDALTTIGGNLDVTTNTSLTSLSGLDSLTTINGILEITTNTSLTSLSGLEMLESIGGRLTITGNTALTDFCAVSSLIGDDNQITSGEYSVTTNGYNPPYTLIDDENYCSNLDGRIFDGNLTLTSQASIDTFSYRRITGNLTISGGNITNLDGLNGLDALTEIGGTLTIVSNDSLTSLSGLDALTEIGGNIDVNTNTSLTSLRGLDSLTTINGILRIISNTSLPSLRGLEALTTIGGNLDVNANTSLTSLRGLDSLIEIGGTLTIFSNDTLTSLSGLDALTEIGGNLDVTTNTSLTSLSGLDALTEIGGNLDVTTNTSLTSLSGLDALTTVNGILQITTNTSLTSLSGLEMLESIGGRLTITGNTALTDFCAVSSLIGDDKQITLGEYTLNTNSYNPSYALISNETFCSNADGGIFVGNLTVNNQAAIDTFNYRGITGNLTIDDAANGNITNLDSLRGLIEVRGVLSVGNNASLTSLRGLEDLIEIEGTLYIGFNASLTSLRGLDALTTVNGILQITTNASLTSLSGLEMLESIGGALTITTNLALTDFCPISSLVGDANQITSGEYTVNGNSYNPSYAAIQSTTACFVIDVILTSQAEIDGFVATPIRNLTIEEAIVGNIINLNSLSDLTFVNGELRIVNNAMLTSLSGLSDLTSMNGGVSIENNAMLISLSGLNDLTSVNGRISIVNNAMLTSLSGLENLRTIRRSLVIRGNPELASLTALTSLTSIEELIIDDNDEIYSLSGLERINNLGSLVITGNASLTNLCGISHLLNDAIITTSRDYTVSGNNHNPLFANIGTRGLCFIPEVILTSQAEIDAFTATEVTGNLVIKETIPGDITNLNGLSRLTTIEKQLIIEAPSSSRHFLGGRLCIKNNTALTSLDGLEMLESIESFLAITGNTALTNFCAISSLVGDGNQITSGEYTVSGNRDNPSYTFIQSETLCSDALGSVFIGDLTLNNQESIDAFDYIGVTGNLTIDDSIAGNITNLDSLIELTQVGGSLRIENNDTLTSLNGLDGITRINPTLTITNNNSLVDFCALSSALRDGNQLSSTQYNVSGNGYDPPYAFIQSETPCSNALGSVFIGDLTLNNQASIDTFNYSGVTGNLTIDDSIAGNITNLDSLIELTQVGGSLRIENNDMLTSLNGLDGITRINPTLTITNNNSLVDFCALSSALREGNQLSSTQYSVSGNGYNPPYTFIQSETLCSDASGSIFIGDLTLNDQASIDAFDYIGVTGNLTIDDAMADNIRNLDSLRGLIQVGGSLRIAENDILTSLTGFTSLRTVVGQLIIHDNDILTSLGGLETLETIGSNLTITNNISLVDFCAISSLVGDDKQITSTEYILRANSYNPSYDLIVGENFCSNVAGEIFFGDLILANQSSIDAFNYSSVTGNLIIDETINNDIRNLNNLISLTRVGGNLEIRLNSSLMSLSGLESLIEIGGDLQIQSNTSLLSMNGLESLIEIGGDLQIQSNTSLLSMNGLESLTEIGGNLQIQFNASFLSLSGLEFLTEIRGNLQIANNLSLRSLSGLDFLTRIDGYLQISHNISLTSLSGLGVLTNVGEYVRINNNNTLASLSGLDSLTSINGNLDILFNNSLESLSGLESLLGIGGDLAVSSNNSLESLSGLESLLGIGGDLAVSSNNSLESLSGLESLPSIGGDLAVSSNNSLASLNGLGSLITIGGNLAISSNSSLPSLSGLEMLESIGGILTITGNTEVTDFCILSSLIGNENDIVNGEYTVNGNGNNPTYTEIQTTTRCRLDPPVVAAGLQDVSIQLGTIIPPIHLNLAFSDPNGDPLTYTATSSDETAVTVSVNDFTLTITGIVEGTATITVTATDDTDFFVSTEFMVSITLNIAPVVENPLTDVSIQPGAGFETIDISATFSDANGDPLTYMVTSSDETTVTAAISGDTLMLTEVSEGTATITVTATDDAGLSFSTNFMVFITLNLPPVVENPLEAIETISGTAFETIDISTVFSDPDGDDDALTYTVATSNVAIVTASLNATTLTLTETGKGTATITVTARDEFGLSFDAPFEVTLTNTSPIVENPLTDVAIQPGAGFETIDISATFSDASGDPLTYMVTSSDETIVTAAISGDTLMLTEVSTGTATITVTATDDAGLSFSTNFMVFITLNLPPVVENPLEAIETISGTAFETIDISTVFSDPDGDDDALTYTVATSNAAIVTASLNATTLTLTETGKGTATITVTARDEFGLPFDAPFEVTLINTAPEIIANQLINVFSKPGIPFASIDLSTAFTDTNGDVLTYTATSSDTALVTVSISDSILTITEVGVEEGRSTIMVTASDGDSSVTGTFMAIISNNSRPLLTAISFPNIPTVAVGYQLEPTINLIPFFSDPDGDRLTYTTTVTDSSVVTVEIVEISRWTFTAIGSGTTEIMLTATDPEGLSVSRSIMITVEEGEEPPPPPLGIADTDIVAVYPNPSSGVFQLSRMTDAVRVYDMSGRLIYQGSNINQLDLTNNPAGKYLVEVRVGKERGRYTVIRE